MKTIEHPDEIAWFEGPLPDAHSVDKECVILVWIANPDGSLVGIIMAHPWEDDLNPLRWCGSSGFPLAGYCFPDKTVKYWTWIKC